jgi:hypothetical protein
LDQSSYLNLVHFISGETVLNPKGIDAFEP